MVNKQQILDKIEKLQQMQSSSNEQEVETATIMISKLMRKHNIDENQLNKIKTKALTVDYTEVALKYSLRSWVKRLAATISDLYECRATVSLYNRRIQFLGFTPDIDIAAEMFKFTYDKFKILSEQKLYSDSPASTNVKRNSYLHGCIDGLITKTRIIKNETLKQQQALVLLKAEEIEKHLPKTSTKAQRSTKDEAAYKHGFNDGYNCNLNKTICGSK